MKFRLKITATTLALLLISAPGLAETGNTKQDVRTASSDVSVILADLRDLNARVESGEGELARLTPAQLRDFRNNHDTVVSLLHGHALVQDLPMDQRVRAHNALEAIVAIVNHQPDEQIVCRRERPVGTRMVQTVCRPVRDSRAGQEESLATLRRPGMIEWVAPGTNPLQFQGPPAPDFP